MSIFNSAEPILRFKQEALDFQDRVGLLQIRWRWGDRTISRFYTRIDQIFLLWGIITAVIFGVAQFCPVTWTVQALIWSGLTLLGVLGMGLLAWFWVTVERLRWLIYSWAGLMILGVFYTDLCVLAGQWQLSPYLCPVWLGLSAIGYLVMGWGMRSRTFLLTAGLHLASIPLLPYTGHWQFLTTGIVIAGCLLFLSEVQWDMRPPIEFAVLTLEQRQFNHGQHQKRQYQA